MLYLHLFSASISKVCPKVIASTSYTVYGKFNGNTLLLGRGVNLDSDFLAYINSDRSFKLIYNIHMCLSKKLHIFLINKYNTKRSFREINLKGWIEKKNLKTKSGSN